MFIVGVKNKLFNLLITKCEKKCHFPKVIIEFKTYWGHNSMIDCMTLSKIWKHVVQMKMILKSGSCAMWGHWPIWEPQIDMPSVMFVNVAHHD